MKLLIVGWVGLAAVILKRLLSKPSEEAKPGKISPQSLYERIGGSEAITAAANLFYKKCYSDDRIKHWFDGVPQDIQEKKLGSFMIIAFGGDANYTGKDLAAAHAEMVQKGLGDKDFDVVMELLGQTLQELSVPGDIITEAAGIVETTRDAVLGRATA